MEEAQSFPLMPVNDDSKQDSNPPPAYITIIDGGSEGGGDDDNDDNDLGGNEDGNDNNIEDSDHTSGDDDHALTRPLQRPQQWQAAVMGSKRPSFKELKQRGDCPSPSPSGQRGDAHEDHPPPPNTDRDHTDRSARPEELITTFNVGGMIFETCRSTLLQLPGSPLADCTFLRRHYRPDKAQYFFDRDPDVFGAILNYLRTGELHLPIKYCGPAVKEEIEECCWTKYSAWTTTLEALRKLERDRKVNMPRSVQQIEDCQGTRTRNVGNLRQLQLRGWTLLNSPHSGLPAKIYSYVSLIFVVVSIFSFIAQTHPFFRVTLDEGNASTAHGLNSTGNTTTTRVNETTSPEDSDAHPAMLCVDAVCLVFFIIEFLLRILFSPRKCKLFVLPMTVFELLALLPDLIEFGWRIFNPTLSATMAAMDVITFLRLLRVFRIFRLMRHFPGLWILFYTLKASIKELLLLFLCVGMLFFASLIYYTDNRKVFTSIPMACWWSIVTMTTVGYGDMFPTTKWGYVVGSMTAVCGVLVIGFTVPVLVNNFILYYQHTQCSLNRENAKRVRAEIKRSMRRKPGTDPRQKPFISKKLKEATITQDSYPEKQSKENQSS